MAELTTTAGVRAMVIILTTLLFILTTLLVVKATKVLLTTLLVISATKVFRSCSRDNNGCVVPNIIPNASSTSSACWSWKYDVFLNFRGEDTRKTFVDHLYSALQQHGIHTYKDDVTLDRGDTIRPALLSAIRESHISLIIFSENYAFSSWCLDELKHIMRCKEEDSGQIVIPIFYNVDPADVRKQIGQFGKAFAKHELSESNKKKIESWKKALVDASNIAGWEPKHVANGKFFLHCLCVDHTCHYYGCEHMFPMCRHEARCIQEIVGSILDKLSSLDSVVEDGNLVGMRTRLQQLRSHLRIGSGGVRMVGVWGIGGGGKTTLATSLYKEISHHFDGCCFLGNIRDETKQHGLQKLQEKVLSTVFDKLIQVESVELGKHKIKSMLYCRKVLIVLDDVDHLEQLEALAGCHNWFGNGSRIIITARDEQVLKSHRIDEVCPVKLLSNEEAIRLFKRHSYQEHNVVEEYDKLSLEVITYANRLPLALQILGASLYGKDKDEWISTLARLQDHPEMGIVEKLKISYDGLKPIEKELFLDIACFFRRRSKDEAMEILDACGFEPHIGVEVLIQKTLLTVSEEGWFDMHDLVQEMGHYIVTWEHPYNPKKHSRVWRKEDIEDICSMNATMENDKIEAIQCDAYGPSFNFIRLVSSMKKLRFLRLTTISFDERPNFLLSNELRYIDWKGYLASPFPESFQPRKLVILKLERSWQLKELWKGYKYLPCLKKMELYCMYALVRTPDFGGLPSLQKLVLHECENLEEIHQSLGNHASLVSVEVRCCRRLTRFPSIFRMEKLETLNISFCELTEFPKIEANMDNLVTLTLKGVDIEILPSTIVEYCTNLTSLSLEDCSKLKSIDGNFHALKGLQNIKLKGCKHFEKLPKDLFNENIVGLGLIKLNLSWCELKDGDIPPEIGELSTLQELHLWGNDFTRLDFSLSRLTRLKLLNLSWCQNLVELPELPSSLAVLKAHMCGSLEVIKDDAHRRCNWLCEVSIRSRRKNRTGGERLLESMLQKFIRERELIVGV
uniref:TMV resistance protein N-like isoform X2 n=1 Tax=Erigeron canadensis TaxID=72917 RepID=UPI001CB9D56F|nr:TMV resistance protein N-like isoform X2 [Erigeron canadensis]